MTQEEADKIAVSLLSFLGGTGLIGHKRINACYSLLTDKDRALLKKSIGQQARKMLDEGSRDLMEWFLNLSPKFEPIDFSDTMKSPRTGNA